MQQLKALRETRDVLLQELKACNVKLRDAEADVAAGVERGRARAKSEQVQTAAFRSVWLQAVVTIRTWQDAAVAVLREALAAAEKRSDAAAAAADAAAAVEAVRSEKEIELRGQLLSLQKQQADAAAAAATAAAASAKRDAAVASLEQR